MKKVIVNILMILLAFLFQSSFFQHFSLGGIVPNILIIVTVASAIINGSLEGCLVGFAAGLLLDFSFGDHVSVYALGYLIIGYTTGILNRIFYKEDITLPIIVIAIADFCYGVYMYITGFLIRGRLDFLFYVRRIILPEVVYTVIIAIFLYRAILLINHYVKKKGSENPIV